MDVFYEATAHCGHWVTIATLLLSAYHCVQVVSFLSDLYNMFDAIIDKYDIYKVGLSLSFILADFILIQSGYFQSYSLMRCDITLNFK